MWKTSNLIAIRKAISNGWRRPKAPDETWFVRTTLTGERASVAQSIVLRAWSSEHRVQRRNSRVRFSFWDEDCFSASGPSPKAMAAGDWRIAMTVVFSIVPWFFKTRNRLFSVDLHELQDLKDLKDNVKCIIGDRRCIKTKRGRQQN